MPIGDFNTVAGLAIPDEHFDTVGGWVLDLFGRVPHRGESVEADGVRVTVETMHRTRSSRCSSACPPRTSASPNGRTRCGHGRPEWGRAVSLGTTLGIVLLSLLASAFFSSAEIAFLAANRVRLRHLAERGSRVARATWSVPAPGAAPVHRDDGVTIAHVVSSAVATAALLPWVGGQASLWATVILTPLMLVFGEIVPKALTQPRATEVALRTFDPLRGGAWLLAPVVGVANLLVRAILGALGHGERRDPFVSRADLRLLVEREPDGTTDVLEEEREMIEGIFDLVETSVREVMVPLVDVVAVPEDVSTAEVIAKIQQSGHSRLPVYRERIDNVVGVVAVLDILGRGATGETIRTLMRPAHYARHQACERPPARDAAPADPARRRGG